MTFDPQSPGHCPTNLEELPLVLTVTEAARVLRIGRTSAYKLVQQHRASAGADGLPSLRLGGRVMIRKVDLVALIDHPRAS